jgi:hypothetical protein
MYRVWNGRLLALTVNECQRNRGAFEQFQAQNRHNSKKYDFGNRLGKWWTL